jgi:hypothetical protein
MQINMVTIYSLGKPGPDNLQKSDGKLHARRPSEGKADKLKAIAKLEREHGSNTHTFE